MIENNNAELIAEAREWCKDHRHGYQEYAGGPQIEYAGVDSVRNLADTLEAAEARIAALTADRDATAAENKELLEENLALTAAPDGDARERLESEMGGVIFKALAKFSVDGSDRPCDSRPEFIARAILAAFPALSRAAAPEPEWAYGRMYFDEAGDPHIRETTDVTSPDGHRADGSPYWNYRPMRRRKAGPWLSVEGEKP